MQPRLTWSLLLLVVVGTAIHQLGSVSASSSAKDGFKEVEIASARFAEIDVMNRAMSSNGLAGEKHTGDVWFSLQKTSGASDLYVQSNVWQPGGSTGWHTHRGHSLIIVTEGVVTGYDGDDPQCRPHLYPAGVGFVDPGGEHVHLLRNEGEMVAKTVAVQLIQAGQQRRVEAADPGNCHF